MINFIYNTDSSWVRRDIQQLQLKGVELKLLFLNSFLSSFNFARLSVGHSLFWFASLKFLPLLLISRLCGKKCYVIAGGYDVYTLQTTGLFKKSLRKLFFNLSHEIICVSQTLRSELICIYPGLAPKTSVIYHGFSAVAEERVLSARREKSIVMISHVKGEGRIKLKGYDYFCDLTKLLPDYEFHHVGEILDKDRLEGIHHHGAIDDEESIQEILLRSEYCFQFSRYESFGASVIEGALCGCYPLLSSNGALPEIAEVLNIKTFKSINDVREFILSKKSIKFSPVSISSIAVTRFSVEARIDKLQSLLSRDH